MNCSENWESSICADLQDQDLDGALKAFQEDEDPLNLAIVKYEPSVKDPETLYADELYLPPPEELSETLLGQEFPPVWGKPNSVSVSTHDRRKFPIMELSPPGLYSLEFY